MYDSFNYIISVLECMHACMCCCVTACTCRHVHMYTCMGSGPVCMSLHFNLIYVIKANMYFRII